MSEIGEEKPANTAPFIAMSVFESQLLEAQKLLLERGEDPAKHRGIFNNDGIPET